VSVARIGKEEAGGGLVKSSAEIKRKTGQERMKGVLTKGGRNRMQLPAQNPATGRPGEKKGPRLNALN